MGGGTGTGAAPIVAEIARELGVLTVAVVTKPFPFEGRKRMKIAEEGIKELRGNVDSLIIIPNEKLMQVLGKNCSLINAFSAANNVLKGAVQGIADLITRPGMINVDFADVRTVMSEMGMAMMGTAVARGDNRAQEAAEQAIRSPLLEDIDLKGASGILVNIAAGEDLSLGEFTEVGNIVEEYASDDATIVVGTVIDPELGDDIKVTVVATGLDRGEDANLRVVHSKQGNGRKPDGSLDLDQIELPTILRRQREEALIEKPGERKSSESGRDESDYGMLDIPTFLRRQAD
jgi:cell division protein FtsZ